MKKVAGARYRLQGNVMQSGVFPYGGERNQFVILAVDEGGLDGGWVEVVHGDGRADHDQLPGRDSLRDTMLDIAAEGKSEQGPWQMTELRTEVFGNGHQIVGFSLSVIVFTRAFTYTTEVGSHSDQA